MPNLLWPSLQPFVYRFRVDVGVWPLVYGLSMWLSQSMTPQTGIDPTQQIIFKLMPIMFTFILAQYAVGLLIYWTWSSLITILQQYVMNRTGLGKEMRAELEKRVRKAAK